jgi:hypothetical protein
MALLRNGLKSLIFAYTRLSIDRTARHVSYWLTGSLFADSLSLCRWHKHLETPRESSLLFGHFCPRASML